MKPYSEHVCSSIRNRITTSSRGFVTAALLDYDDPDKGISILGIWTPQQWYTFKYTRDDLRKMFAKCVEVVGKKPEESFTFCMKLIDKTRKSRETPLEKRTTDFTKRVSLPTCLPDIFADELKLDETISWLVISSKIMKMVTKQ